MPPERAAFSKVHQELLLGVFALLVSDAAACFASGLAGSLAFAASAVLCAVAEVASLESLDMFHFSILRKIRLQDIITYRIYKVNRIFLKYHIPIRLFLYCLGFTPLQSRKARLKERIPPNPHS